MGRQGLIHSTNLFNFSLAHFEHPEFELPNKLEITSCNGISLKKNLGIKTFKCHPKCPPNRNVHELLKLK